MELKRTHSRSRFLHGRYHNYKSVTSKGRIDPADAGLYDNIQYADGSKEKNSGAKMAATEAAKNGEVVPATNGEAKDTEERGSDEVLRTEKERDEQGYPEGERKKGVLRKLHLHKV